MRKHTKTFTEQKMRQALTSIHSNVRRKLRESGVEVNDSEVQASSSSLDKNDKTISPENDFNIQTDIQSSSKPERIKNSINFRSSEHDSIYDDETDNKRKFKDGNIKIRVIMI